jgi:hypothetical protein
MLHSVLGLPSVISGRQGGANWGDKDPGERKRDALNAEQRAMEAWRRNDEGERESRSADAGTEIPVKKFVKRGDEGERGNKSADAGPETPEKKSVKNGGHSNSGTTGDFRSLIADLDLYMPFQQSMPPFLGAAPVTFPGATVGVDSVNLIWTMVRNAMVRNATVRYGAVSEDGTVDARIDNISNRVIHEKTLLPYLLFSPYSPLHLTHLPPPKGITVEHCPNDRHTYFDAFEDLLLASQGKPMQDWSSEGLFPARLFRTDQNGKEMLERSTLCWPSPQFHDSDDAEGRRNIVNRRANTGMFWMCTGLRDSGVLASPDGSPDIESMLNSILDPKLVVSPVLPETELDMYNQFVKTSPEEHLKQAPEIKNMISRAEVAVASQCKLDDGDAFINPTWSEVAHYTFVAESTEKDGRVTTTIRVEKVSPCGTHIEFNEVTSNGKKEHIDWVLDMDENQLVEAKKRQSDPSLDLLAKYDREVWPGHPLWSKTVLSRRRYEVQLKDGTKLTQILVMKQRPDGSHDHHQFNLVTRPEDVKSTMNMNEKDEAHEKTS